MTKQMALKFVVFLGTVRENNFGSRVAKFIVRKLETKGHTVELLGEAIGRWCVGSTVTRWHCFRPNVVGRSPTFACWRKVGYQAYTWIVTI